MRIRTFASVALAALAVIGFASPALAHDTVDTTSPAATSVVATAPTAVTLTFVEPVIEIGNQVVVKDDNGTDWVNGDVQVSDRTVTQPLKQGMPDGVYTVVWRVVSEDGHPVSGSYVFGVGSSADLQALVAEAADAIVQPADNDAEVTAVATPVAISSAPADGVWMTVAIAVGGALIAIALFWSAISIIRRRQQ